MAGGRTRLVREPALGEATCGDNEDACQRQRGGKSGREGVLSGSDGQAQAASTREALWKAGCNLSTAPPSVGWRRSRRTDAPDFFQTVGRRVLAGLSGRQSASVALHGAYHRRRGRVGSTLRRRPTASVNGSPSRDVAQSVYIVIANAEEIARRCVVGG